MMPAPHPPPPPPPSPVWAKYTNITAQVQNPQSNFRYKITLTLYFHDYSCCQREKKVQNSEHASKTSMAHLLAYSNDTLLAVRPNCIRSVARFLLSNFFPASPWTAPSSSPRPPQLSYQYTVHWKFPSAEIRHISKHRAGPQSSAWRSAGYTAITSQLALWTSSLRSLLPLQSQAPI